mmetsp:Transcript_53974/g.161538  ORF Transcript_53974/g.161538 Transcript_53974/m.161538 type:complete len:84 (+) Transcript_53974:2090-2341(+)
MTCLDLAIFVSIIFFLKGHTHPRTPKKVPADDFLLSPIHIVSSRKLNSAQIDTPMNCVLRVRKLGSSPLVTKVHRDLDTQNFI